MYFIALTALMYPAGHTPGRMEWLKMTDPMSLENGIGYHDHHHHHHGHRSYPF